MVSPFVPTDIEICVKCLEFLVCLLVATTVIYKKNYFIHVFLAIGILWFGIEVMINFEESITAVLVMIMFSLLLAMFSVADKRNSIK